MMRLEDWPKSLTAKLVVIPPGAQEELIITVNDNVLDDFFGEKVVMMDDNIFITRLFSIQNIAITYDSANLRCLKITNAN